MAGKAENSSKAKSRIEIVVTFIAWVASYVLGAPKTLSLLSCCLSVAFAQGMKEPLKSKGGGMIMEIMKAGGRNKGGRPKKSVKRIYVIKVKCTILERKAIERRANEVGMSLSEYLREKGIAGTIVSRQKVLPKEFLEYKALVHHTASNINQIARKLNATGEVNSFEKEMLLSLEQELEHHIQNVQKRVQS